MNTPSPVSAATLEALRHVSTATVTTQLMGHGLRNTYLQGVLPLNPAQTRMVGEAFTLRYIPSREDIDVLSIFQDYDHPQRRAIESVGADTILVIDARGQTRSASLGRILALRLLRCGGAGIVTDGSVRDSPGFLTLDLPTFAAGVSATTVLGQHHAVDMQVPIGCAGVAVYPGDIIVGDGEGVACIPRHLAAEVADAAVRQEHLEEFVVSRIEAGEALRGIYPPNEQTLADYQRWAEQHPLASGTPDAGTS